MADLEALSNKELRQKCMEYGMPNVPVTDSSRKILIRRLEAVMSGKPLTPNKTSRRETMHVSKPSQMASSLKKDLADSKTAAATTTTTTNENNNTTKVSTNRPSRRTIAATTERHVATTTTVSEPEYSDVSPDRIEITITKKKTPEKPLYPVLPTKEPSPKPQQLSKTGVVTTSYVRETQNANKTYAAPSEEEIDSSEEYVQEPIRAAAPTLSKASSNFAYVPVAEPKITTSVPISNTLSSSTRYSALSTAGGTFGNYTKPLSLSSAEPMRKSYVQPTASFASSIAASASSYRKPTLTTTTKYNKFQEGSNDVHYVEDDYDYEVEDDEVVMVDDDSPLGKDIQTPFLSQFARNLETLKSTPLRSSMAPSSGYTPSNSGLRQRETAASYRRTMPPVSSSSISARRSTAQKYSASNQNAGDSSFRQFMMAMDEKYHLKQTFVLISIFISAVFIYVFFIQSV